MKAAGLLFLTIVCAVFAHAEMPLPALPKADAEVMLPAQEWPRLPGPRTINIYIRYPGGKLKNVKRTTGLMLTLHNWGGTRWDGTADPVVLANKFDVVAIAVDYLQSGKWDPAVGLPYDCGPYQAIDALTALSFVSQKLSHAEVKFDRHRIFAVGGSGGGTVALMCNKLAPRTFTCIVDVSGLAKLTDDIAFNLEGGSTLNAGYSRDSASPNYLSPAQQRFRWFGDPAQLAQLKSLGNRSKIVVVHGVDDTVCPVTDAQQMTRNMLAAGLDVEAHFISEKEVDGDIIRKTGHSDLGDRTRVICHFGAPYFDPARPVKLDDVPVTGLEKASETIAYICDQTEFTVSNTRGLPRITVTVRR
jgi:predicted esterase